MGTNYYLHKKTATCPTCGHTETPKHIGKSSAGWCFALVSNGANDPSDCLQRWAREWSKDDVEIRDEYNRLVTPGELLMEITQRSQPRPPMWTPGDYAANDAIPGPNNLVRHQIGSFCFAHGAGTYDVCKPGFS